MHSPDAIAKSILELWDNYDLRCTMGKRSRTIAEGLTWRRVADDYIDLYERTLRAVRAGGKLQPASG